MDAKTLFQAIIKFLSGVIILALLIFVPAGSMGYFQGWLLMGILFVPMLIAGIIMMLKNPELLKKRLNNKEEQSEQKLVIVLSALVFVAAFVIAGLNYRHNWFPIPMKVSYIAAGVFFVAYALYAEVMRENIYLSRTVEVQKNQKVVDTGLYRVVRHPMYLSTVLLFLAMPLVLGSVISFAVMLLYIPIIVIRINNEEKVLEAGLKGYPEYEQKVKYRLIPFIW